ncbi:MAG: radical SAM protein [Pseudomonadota bacterium]
MKLIPNLEIHVVHGCNLSCDSCSHYSNHGHKGVVSLDEADHWMNLWNRRLAPRTISLLGGEPTIHPHLPEFLILVRRKWPEVRLRLVTNGFFLHRHPALPRVLKNDPNACIDISIHHDAPEYVEKLRSNLDLLMRWIRQYGICVTYSESFKQWTRRYKGFGSKMKPFADGQPRRSWEKCRAKYCPQLFEEKIWKCGPLAYLKLQDATYQLSDEWIPYLRYQPLDPGCTEKELQEFFAREEESYCGMCAAAPQQFGLQIPLR